MREKRVRDMEARIEAYNDMLAQSYVENGESDAIAKSGPHSDATAEGSDQSGDEQETFETAYVEQGTYSTVTVEGISVSKFGLDSQTADTDIADIGQGKKTVIQPAGEAPKKVKVLKGRRSRQSRPRAASASRKGRAAKSPKDSRDRVKSGGRKSHPSKRK